MNMIYVVGSVDGICVCIIVGYMRMDIVIIFSF